MRSKNIFAAFSNLYLYDSIFLDDGEISSPFLYQIYGAFINCLDVPLFMKNNSFLNGTALDGGAIYISGESFIDASQILFTGNRALGKGGAVSGINFLNITIFDQSIFLDNLARQGGDDIYSLNTIGNVALIDSSISNPNG